MSSLTLLRPDWLWALLPLIALGWWLHARPSDLGGWHRAARPEMLRAMEALGHVDQAGRPWGRWAGLCAAALCILALSGPAVERRDALTFRNLDAVIFVLDVSDQMTERSDWPQVLALGRFAIASLGTRPGALIVYGGDAYVATDLTRDVRQLGQTYSLIEPGLVPDPGARPDLSLALAQRVLTEAEILTADVVLISSGAGLTEEMALPFRDQGARLSVVAPSGAGVALAAAGGGLSLEFDDIDPLSAFLKGEARTVLERDDYPLLYWRDLGRYLLLLAALPLLTLFRRHRI